MYATELSGRVRARAIESVVRDERLQGGHARERQGRCVHALGTVYVRTKDRVRALDATMRARRGYSSNAIRATTEFAREQLSSIITVCV